MPKLIGDARIFKVWRRISRGTPLQCNNPQACIGQDFGENRTGPTVTDDDGIDGLESARRGHVLVPPMDAGP
jgi:hypothetical protein